MVGKQLEMTLNFEGQEIKVTTDKGKELFNLANSARVLGIVQKKSSGYIVNWKSGNNNVTKKLYNILIFHLIFQGFLILTQKRNKTKQSKTKTKQKRKMLV